MQIKFYLMAWSR